MAADHAALGLAGALLVDEVVLRGEDGPPAVGQRPRAVWCSPQRNVVKTARFLFVRPEISLFIAIIALEK